MIFLLIRSFAVDDPIEPFLSEVGFISTIHIFIKTLSNIGTITIVRLYSELLSLVGEISGEEGVMIIEFPTG